MRLGTLLGVMAVAGVGFVIAATTTGSAWPLFLMWPAFAVAVPLARRDDTGPVLAGPGSEEAAEEAAGEEAVAPGGGPPAGEESAPRETAAETSED